MTAGPALLGVCQGSLDVQLVSIAFIVMVGTFIGWLIGIMMAGRRTVRFHLVKFQLPRREARGLTRALQLRENRLHALAADLAAAGLTKIDALLEADRMLQAEGRTYLKQLITIS